VEKLRFCVDTHTLLHRYLRAAWKIDLDTVDNTENHACANTLTHV